MIERTKIIFLAVLVAFAFASPFVGKINPYYYDILLSIGINIILAAGLNLVNGYTGQFSLGHAGFMAVGAYASSWRTLAYGHLLGLGQTGMTTAFVIAPTSGWMGGCWAPLSA